MTEVRYRGRPGRREVIENEPRRQGDGGAKPPAKYVYKTPRDRGNGWQPPKPAPPRPYIGPMRGADWTPPQTQEAPPPDPADTRGRALKHHVNKAKSREDRDVKLIAVGRSDGPDKLIREIAVHMNKEEDIRHALRVFPEVHATLEAEIRAWRVKLRIGNDDR